MTLTSYPLLAVVSGDTPAEPTRIIAFLTEVGSIPQPTQPNIRLGLTLPRIRRICDSVIYLVEGKGIRHTSY